MRMKTRPVLAAVVTCSIGFGGAALALPAWVGGLELNLWSTTDGRAQCQCDNRFHRPEAESRAIMQRITLKMAIVNDMLEGNVSFEEATAQFLELNRTAPEAMTHTREVYPASSDEESTALQLVNFARAGLHPESSDYSEKLRRLDLQFEIMREKMAASSGPVVTRAD